MRLERRITLALLIGFLALSFFVRAADSILDDEPVAPVQQESAP